MIPVFLYKLLLIVTNIHIQVNIVQILVFCGGDAWPNQKSPLYSSIGMLNIVDISYIVVFLNKKLTSKTMDWETAEFIH